MGLLQAFILGIVQGATEFLPVSSSGHLVLIPAFLRWDSPPLVFDTTVHLATLVAVVAVFWRDLLGLPGAWWRSVRSGQPFQTAESRLAWFVILGTIPGVLAGVLLEGFFESLFGNPPAVAGFLLLTALLLLLAEFLGRRRRGLAAMNWLDSLLIGIGQAAAIAPGLSRSGATMSVGMYLGLTRDAAARFSFILSIPIILGAGIMQSIEAAGNNSVSVPVPELVIGFIAAGVSGYLSIRLFLAYLRKRPLYPFAVYCIVLGVVALVLL